MQVFRPRLWTGERRVHAELREVHGVRVSRKCVQRLMAAADLQGAGRRPRPRTTIRVEGVRPALDLVECDFCPAAPNELWCSDFTYIETGEGWLYVAGVLDCFSRRLVGWSMADHMRTELAVAALEMAVRRRRPACGSCTTQTRAARANTSRSPSASEHATLT